MNKFIFYLFFMLSWLNFNMHARNLKNRTPTDFNALTNISKNQTNQRRYSLANKNGRKMSKFNATQEPLYFSDISHLLSGYESHQCYQIPKNLTLCNDIGYDMMVLPNSLDHAKMDEVILQSEGWLRLVYSGCHLEVSRFLCAIYAPVCIPDHREKLIPPCRELCEGVRDSCLPIMSDFGLGWPDMVTCSHFPKGPAELCIPSNKQTKHRCFGCTENPRYENAIGSFCVSDIAIRARIQQISQLPATNNESNILQLGSGVKVFKMNPTMKSLFNISFHLDCDCPSIRADLQNTKAKSRWLIMGKVTQSGKIVHVQHLSQISNENVELKRALRSIRKNSNSICQVDIMQSKVYSNGRGNNLVPTTNAVKGGKINIENRPSNGDSKKRRRQNSKDGRKRSRLHRERQPIMS